jgi:hypothetical protein
MGWRWTWLLILAVGIGLVVPSGLERKRAVTWRGNSAWRRGRLGYLTFDADARRLYVLGLRVSTSSILTPARAEPYRHPGVHGVALAKELGKVIRVTDGTEQSRHSTEHYANVGIAAGTNPDTVPVRAYDATSVCFQWWLRRH